MNKATISGGNSYLVSNEHDKWLVDGNPINWDVSEIGNGRYHILLDRKGFNVEIIKIDRATKTVCLQINKRRIIVGIQSKLDILVDSMGMHSSEPIKHNFVRAPMPGLIADLYVKAGDAIKAGDPLLVLEAMKMENIIKSPCDGVIKTVEIEKGDSVDKKQVLIEF